MYTVADPGFQVWGANRITCEGKAKQGKTILAVRICEKSKLCEERKISRMEGCISGTPFL